MLGLEVRLSLTDLSGARGVTNNELDEEADSLQGTIMPNGHKYEEWLKEIESHGENR